VSIQYALVPPRKTPFVHKGTIFHRGRPLVFFLLSGVLVYLRTMRAGTWELGLLPSSLENLVSPKGIEFSKGLWPRSGESVAAMVPLTFCVT